jgi:hypothetical protein
MKRLVTLIAGIALVAAGVAGLILSIAGIVVLARVERVVEPVMMKQVELIDRTLATTAEGLALAETSLALAADTATSLETAVAGAGQAVGDTAPMVDSVADLLGEQLPATIRATQDTLASVATSAKLVDDVLSVVTAIPLLGTERYDPEVSLHQGLADVAASLDEVPISLGVAQEELTSTSGNLEGLHEDLTVMADDIGQLSTSLESAKSVVARYQGTVADLQALVASVRQGLPGWLRLLHLVLSFVLVWLGIAQIGLMIQGWELIGRGRAKGEE